MIVLVVLTVILIIFAISGMFVMFAGIEECSGAISVIGILMILVPVILIAGGAFVLDTAECTYEMEHQVTSELLPIDGTTYIIGTGTELKGVSKYTVCMHAGGTDTKFVDIDASDASINYDSTPRAETYKTRECAKLLFFNVCKREFEFTRLYVPEHGYKQVLETL